MWKAFLGRIRYVGWRGTFFCINQRSQLGTLVQQLLLAASATAALLGSGNVWHYHKMQDIARDRWGGRNKEGAERGKRTWRTSRIEGNVEGPWCSHAGSFRSEERWGNKFFQEYTHPRGAFQTAFCSGQITTVLQHDSLPRGIGI